MCDSRTPRLTLALLASVGAIVLAGCGPMSADELRREVDTIHSTAAEASVLADQIAAQRTKRTFARVQARNLADAAEHSAERLTDATRRGAWSLTSSARSPRRGCLDAAGALRSPPTTRSRPAAPRSAYATWPRDRRAGGVDVKKFFSLALGILAAIGGFVDIGDLVFNTQAGAEFGFQLIWAVIVGVIGIVVFAEMCGRVAAVTGRPVMDVVRQRLGFGAGITTMVGSVLLSVLTLGAEIGGLALVLELFFDAPYATMILLVAVALPGAVAWFLPFEWIERIFGYMGLCLLVYLVGRDRSQSRLGRGRRGFVPSAPGQLDRRSTPTSSSA